MWNQHLHMRLSFTMQVYSYHTCLALECCLATTCILEKIYFRTSVGKYFQMSSFSEANAFKHSGHAAGKFVLYNKRQMSRTYPAGSRVNSSNYNPVPMWNSGCQIGERGREDTVRAGEGSTIIVHTVSLSSCPELPNRRQVHGPQPRQVPPERRLWLRPQASHHERRYTQTAYSETPAACTYM